MRFSTDALVIREMNIGDNDRLVTLMTRDLGVIRAFAVGAKSIKSRRACATALLSYSNFNIEKKGDTYKILEATVNKVFFGAGSDILTLSVAQYFCELCCYLGPHDSECEEFLRLILNSLHFLTQGSKPAELIKAVTELRIAAISGYMPNLIACNCCGKFEDNIMYFRCTDGMLYCKECYSDGDAEEINLSVLKAMRHILYSRFESVYSFKLSEENTHILSNVTEKYICMQSERDYSTLKFYHSLI